MAERWSVRIQRATRAVLTRLYIPTHQLQTIKRAAWVCGTFLLLALLGAVMFVAPLGLTLRPLNWSEAWILSVSALTASGTVPFVLIDTLSIAGLGVVVLWLHLGGIMYMALTLGFLQQLGVSVFRGRSLSVWRVVVVMLVIEVWVTFLLAQSWSQVATRWDEQWFVAFFHASSALANAGFDLRGSDAAFDTFARTPTALSVIAVAVLLGSLGLPLIVDVMAHRRHLPQTRMTLLVIGVMVGGSMLFLLLSPEWHLQHVAWSWPQRFAGAAYESIVSRTAGMLVDSDVMALSPLTRVWLLVTMFVGCAPGAMGGGVSPIAFVLVLAHVRAALSQDATVHLDGYRVNPMLVRRAGVIVVAGVAVILVGSVLLWWLTPLGVAEAFMLATASFATAPVAGIDIAVLPEYSWWIMSALMLWGRLGTFLLMLSLYGRVLPKQRQPDQLWLA